jgi:hypothetical protein
MIRTERQITSATRTTRTTSRMVATSVVMTAPLRGPAAGSRVCLCLTLQTASEFS